MHGTLPSSCAAAAAAGIATFATSAPRISSGAACSASANRDPAGSYSATAPLVSALGLGLLPHDLEVRPLAGPGLFAEHLRNLLLGLELFRVPGRNQRLRTLPRRRRLLLPVAVE